MKIYIENRCPLIPVQTLALAELCQDIAYKFLKAKNTNLYYNNCHMESYNFYEQYKYHLVTEGAKSHKGIPFNILLLKDYIIHYWQ